MRKNGIIKDFKNKTEPGTLNQVEKTNFITGKGMDIQDELRVRSLDIWTASAGKSDHYDQFEQLKETAIKTVAMAKDQSEADKIGLTKWVLEIDTKYLLREYLYNQIFTENQSSAFNKLTGAVAENAKVNQACYNYIDANVLDRYAVKEVIFWAKYYELKLNVTPGTNAFPLLKQSPIFTFFAKPDINADKDKSIIATKGYNDGLLELSYKQVKPSQYYTFLYYYDIIFYRL